MLNLTLFGMYCGPCFFRLSREAKEKLVIRLAAVAANLAVSRNTASASMLEFSAMASAGGMRCESGPIYL
jgi:hypothetical protein